MIRGLGRYPNVTAAETASVLQLVRADRTEGLHFVTPTQPLSQVALPPAVLRGSRVGEGGFERVEMIGHGLVEY